MSQHTWQFPVGLGDVDSSDPAIQRLARLALRRQEVLRSIETLDLEEAADRRLGDELIRVWSEIAKMVITLGCERDLAPDALAAISGLNEERIVQLLAHARR